MKSSLLLSASLAGIALGRVAIDPNTLSMFTGVMPTAMLMGVAGPFVKGTINGGYGKQSSWFGGSSGARVEQTARFAKQFPGSKTVKMRYGPYTVPGMKTHNGLGEGGSLWNYPDTDVARPCSGNCIIVGMNAGLEFEGGRVANIDNNAWLHHFVLFNIGPGRVDQTCQSAWSSLPHANVGCTPLNCERMFSSGNERTPAFMSDWASGGKSAVKPVGYHLRPSDSFAVINDFMNDGLSPLTVYLTITFDYLDGHPAGYDDMRPVWFDVNQCGTSEAKPLSQTGAFTIKANAWTATLDGEILGYAGHLHDGGQKVTLTVDGQEVCQSKATYGGDPAFIAKMDMAGGMSGMNSKSATEHISHMTVCQGPTLKTQYMKKGQSWLLTADYDYSKNKGVLDEDGWQDDIMGIAIMYVRQPWSG